MVRDIRPMTLTYEGQSTTIDMPGWYCTEFSESIHTGEDMMVSDAALKGLKSATKAFSARSSKMHP
jgi:HTH-type transcriptional regulator/antitoxin MqsA